MSVPTVKVRLAKIQAAIDGVRRADAQGPASLAAGDLPMFCNFTGAALFDWNLLGDDQGQETRQYLMRLYVREVGQGIDGEAERLCEPFFGSVLDAFAARPGLELVGGDHLAGVQNAALLGDGGIAIMAYAGQEYIGIEWRLQVVEYVEVVHLG